MSINEKYQEENFQCIILRHDKMGHLCGYVGISDGHPFFGKNYNQCLNGCEGEENSWGFSERAFKSYPCIWKKNHSSIEKLIDVHGGITYSDSCLLNESLDNVWWIGFDCAHLGDLVPKMEEIFPSNPGDVEYRDENYVRNEISNLVKQLKEQR